MGGAGGAAALDSVLVGCVVEAVPADCHCPCDGVVVELESLNEVAGLEDLDPSDVDLRLLAPLVGSP
jgi:hypothetical protein